MNVTSLHQALYQACQNARRVLLTGPMFPDGDSIGACLALARGIRHIWPDLQIDVAGDISYRYAWMPDADAILPDDQVRGTYDLAVVLDGDRRRLEPPVQAAYDAAGQHAIVDHHSSTTAEGYDIALIDHHAASTCEMVYAMLQAWSVPIDATLAALLYTGFIFDTGGFRYSNTTAQTHRQAAALLDTGFAHTPINIRVLMERRASGLKLLGRVLEAACFSVEGRLVIGEVPLQTFSTLQCTQGDLEGIVDTMVFTCGVELACLCVEKGPSRVKLSLRSRQHIDVAALARTLSPDGGGHPRAAGVILHRPLAELRLQLRDQLANALGRAAG